MEERYSALAAAPDMRGRGQLPIRRQHCERRKPLALSERKAEPKAERAKRAA
jgi:hypothetical protein